MEAAYFLGFRHKKRRPWTFFFDHLGHEELPFHLRTAKPLSVQQGSAGVLGWIDEGVSGGSGVKMQLLQAR
jgi:hypothetical protein